MVDSNHVAYGWGAVDSDRQDGIYDAQKFSYSLRLARIDRFGPIDAWVEVATVTLTNASQVYFDLSSIDQLKRLYRIVRLP